jgi:putative membrane protein
MMDGYGWGGWLFGAVMMVGVWVLIFWAVVSLVRRPESQPTTRTAQQILSERFARGEIDADEYARRRDALTGTEATHA